MLDQEPDDDPIEDRPSIRTRKTWGVLGSVLQTLVTLFILGGVVTAILAVSHPESPFPSEWNPTTPLVVNAPVTSLTSWKLRSALNDPEQCRAVLDGAAEITVLDPFEETEHCHIRNRVSLSGVGQARIDPLDTSCATALRLAMWEHHGVQPAARDILGSPVSIVRQIGSYNCRPIRTTQGPSNRWSTHSTGDAIDITGFDLENGSRIRLIDDWDGDSQAAQFLRAVHQSACSWFATTLGPEFNSLHADHFHLQSRGWGTCR